jgi:hypothetical protein
MLALNERHFHAKLAGANRRHIPTRATTNNHYIKILGHNFSLLCYQASGSTGLCTRGAAGAGSEAGMASISFFGAGICCPNSTSIARLANQPASLDNFTIACCLPQLAQVLSTPARRHTL